LNAPGVNAQVGDVLFAINGKVLSQDFSPGMALVNLAGQEVVLTLSNGERKCGDESKQAQAENGLNNRKLQRTVTVKTLYNDTAARYREWVEANRSYVHQQTAGRVGYVHIPDMMSPGYAEFHRGFLAELHRQGLIVDVRFNRGGHVSPLILEKLARRRIGYETARWAQVPVPYPPDSIVGPMAAVTNEYAGSDGDIFSHGFKMLGLGPLIGKRTWGGVIGINPRHTLVEGTITTQPEFSFWFDDVGWGVENYGTDPDIEVELRPQDEAQALDPQLERAVQEVLRRLEETPPQLPDFSQKPGKAAPQLPPR
jgi:tricorn protease